MGHAVHALALQMHRHKCKRQIWVLAACAHWGSRMWLASLLSWLNGQIAAGKVELVHASRYILYGETPLLLRARCAPGRSDSAALQSLADSPIPVTGKSRSAGLSKVVQTEVVVGLLS